MLAKCYGNCRLNLSCTNIIDIWPTNVLWSHYHPKLANFSNTFSFSRLFISRPTCALTSYLLFQQYNALVFSLRGSLMRKVDICLKRPLFSQLCSPAAHCLGKYFWVSEQAGQSACGVDSMDYFFQVFICVYACVSSSRARALRHDMTAKPRRNPRGPTH